MNLQKPTSQSQASLLRLPFSGILCRYSEIATKGRNRGYFEKALIESLHRQLQDITPFKARRERGRILLLPKDPRVESFTEQDIVRVREKINRVFGISSVSPVVRTAPELAAVEAAIDKYFPLLYNCFTETKPRGGICYAMRARRCNRRFPMTSHELEVYFAEKLLPAYPRLKVNLGNPELLVQLEVRDNAAYISFFNFTGPGGMPTGTGGRSLVMLSGGIDSPVAAYQMMRRGCRLDYITYHSAPYTPEASVRKVARLARRLNQYQKPGRLYCINLLPAQKAIRDNCNPRCRTVLYRRIMVRIACRVAAGEKILSLTTGDNLGQVASQTMENLFVINQVADRVIFRPLLTNDKNKTTALAREIDTYDISREEVPDSCTVFAPDKPLTMAEPDKVRAEEGKLDIDSLIEECRKESTVMEPESEEEQNLLLSANGTPCF